MHTDLIQMKYGLFICLAALICTSSCSHAQKVTRDFERHLAVLDSASKTVVGDTIRCCAESLHFLEKRTAIPATGFIDFFGPLAFTKGDLIRWHRWYDVRRRR
jgi:hypothetical protein